jgi:hypothetical protein
MLLCGADPEGNDLLSQFTHEGPVYRHDTLKETIRIIGHQRRCSRLEVGVCVSTLTTESLSCVEGIVSGRSSARETVERPTPRWAVI